MPRLLDDLLYGGFMFGNGLLEGEPDVKQEWRAENRQCTNAVEAARRKCREARGFYRAVAEKEVGVV